ncbi:MAG: hypothetical protein AAF611_04135 [Bacteroidota bacterium]
MNEQLEFFKTCINRFFSLSQGVVCGLTNEKLAFVVNFSDFEKDAEEEKRLADRKTKLKAEKVHEGNGKRVPGWRIAISSIILILVIVRFVTRCSNS